VIVIQPQQRSKRKTDRRDANALSELLWVNRRRLLAKQRVQGVRRVTLPTADEEQDRQLTATRAALVRKRTKTINQIRDILRRHNLEWDRPTKTFQTKKVRQWLASLPLSEVERLTMDHLLEQWKMWDRQIDSVDPLIRVRFQRNKNARVLATIVGVSHYMALTIASRIGSIERFPRGRSLANFFGLTPGSRSSGDQQRTGHITKEGSRLVRFMLGQLVLHMLRRDGKMRAWYKRIKQRRGSKIARVAVMRRIAVIMWHMLSKREAYRYEGPPATERRAAENPKARREPVDRQAVIAAYLGPMVQAGSSAGESTGSSSLCSR
jgi:transposase